MIRALSRVGYSLIGGYLIDAENVRENRDFGSPIKLYALLYFDYVQYFDSRCISDLGAKSRKETRQTAAGSLQKICLDEQSHNQVRST